MILGNCGGNNVAESLRRAAESLLIDTTILCSQYGRSRLRLFNSIAWRLQDRRFPRERSYNKALLTALKKQRPDIVISTGLTPCRASSLAFIRQLGIPLAHFSTDDPFNTLLHGEWFRNTLKYYDWVFTPRSSNVNEIQKATGGKVHFLPFAHDDLMNAGSDLADHQDVPRDVQNGPDILFVGGGDEDRVGFFRDFMKSGLSVTIAGSYWRGLPPERVVLLGQVAPTELTALTQNASINIILVRRANRDGHVMRSFEAAFQGGCLLVEDTSEHRLIFGADGESVRYFANAGQAAAICRDLLSDAETRQRMRRQVQQRIASTGNTYTNRLRTMLDFVLPGWSTRGLA